MVRVLTTVRLVLAALLWATTASALMSASLTQAAMILRPQGAATVAPVITFSAPSASYIYPAASGSILDTVIASVSSGSFLGGGGSFTSSNCPASNIAVASAGAVTVAGPSNLTLSQSCLITAQYPGATSVTQTFTLTGTQQTIASISPCSLGSGCTYSFTNPAVALILGPVPTVTMSGGIGFSAGGGTIVLGTGLQCSAFALAGGNLQITEPNSVTDACTYVITDANAFNSPQTPNISATGSTSPTTNVVGVSLTNENVVPGAAVNSEIGDFSATVTGGGSCSTCTYSMVNTGASSDGVQCGAGSNNFQVVNFGTGQGHLEVLASGLTKRIFGALPSSTGPSFPCVKATPAVGTAYTFPFSIMVRGNEIMGVAPRDVLYTPNSSPQTGTVLATMTAYVHGTAGTPSVALAPQAGDVCSLVTVSGTNIVAGSTPLTNQVGNCHVTYSQTGTDCASYNSLTATPTACTVSLWIAPLPYVGPGDSTYANGAPAVPWIAWTMPYGYSASYCASGTNPIWNVRRESDGAQFSANCLPNGDIDLLGLAAFCDSSMCVPDGPSLPGGIDPEPDQSGHSPANDLYTWQDHNSPPGYRTLWRPYLYFNTLNGVLPSWTNSNASDRFFLNTTTYNGSGSTGVMWSPALVYATGGAIVNNIMNLAAINSGSNPDMYLEYLPSSHVEIIVGPDNGVNATSIISSNTITPNTWTSNIAFINAASTDATCTATIAATTLTSTSCAGIVNVDDLVTGTGITQPASVAVVNTANCAAPTGCTLNSTQTVSSGETVTFTASSPSILDVNGVQTTAQLLPGHFVKWWGVQGGFGGGSNTGQSGGAAVSQTSTLTGPQLSALCLFDQWHLGTLGSC